MAGSMHFLSPAALLEPELLLQGVVDPIQYAMYDDSNKEEQQLLRQQRRKNEERARADCCILGALYASSKASLSLFQLMVNAMVIYM